MEVIELKSGLSRRVADWRRSGKRIGVVPTMGALHAGHISLVTAAKQASDVSVVTLFVNPTQFGPTEDLSKYPRTLQDDLRQLANAQVDAVFAPLESEVYPTGFSTFIEPPDVARQWEGTFRSTHFRGVATVVLKLLNLTQADKAFFGQKDFQQICVVKRMVDDLNMPTEIVSCPTVRESDGLAMSSRNRFLSADERRIALAIPRTLAAAETDIRTGQRNGTSIMTTMSQSMLDSGVTQLDYAVVADPISLGVVNEIRLPVVLLVAALVGPTRLIDNVLVKDK